MLTAFYSWRLLFMTFHGAPRASAEVMAHVHESPRVMTIPLILLAARRDLRRHRRPRHGRRHRASSGRARSSSCPSTTLLEEAHHVPFLIKILPVIVGLIGIALA